MILPVGGTLIDLALSLKARLELYTDAPRNHEWTYHTIGYNIKPQMLLLCREVIMKNRTKWETLAPVSSCSLDELTTVQSQINDLYLSPWCRQHNTFLGSKSCIRRTHCHQDTSCWYGFCLPTHVLYKISTKANISMANRGEGSFISNFLAATSLSSAFSC